MPKNSCDKHVVKSEGLCTANCNERISIRRWISAKKIRYRLLIYIQNNMMARLDSLSNAHGVLVKSNMTSLTPLVNGDGEKLTLVGHPRRFYIDDILASDFGQRCLEERRSLGSENQSDTAAANPGDRSNSEASAIQPNNGTASELDKSTCKPVRVTTTLMTALQLSSSSATSSRHFHNNGISTATSSSSKSTCSNRRPALKDKVVVTMETCKSTDTEVIVKSDSATIDDVTSSVASHLISNTKSGCKADSSDSFKLPAWVYCTRYSDRPSAGNV